MHLTKKTPYSFTIRAVAAALIVFLATLGANTAPTAFAQEADTATTNSGDLRKDVSGRDVSDDNQEKIRRGLEGLTKEGPLGQDSQDVLDMLTDDQFVMQWGETDSLGEAVGLDGLKDLSQNETFLNRLRKAGGSNLADQLIGQVGDTIRGADDLQGLVDTLQGDMGQYQLTGNYTPSDLLASVIFSVNKGDHADSAQIGLDQLARYPSADNPDAQYGKMTDPDAARDGSTDVGEKTAAYIEALYDYQWISTKPNESGSIISWVQKFFDKITGNNDVVSAEQFSRLGLGAGAFFAGIYDMSTSLISWLGEAARSVNILYLFGFADSQDPASDNKFTEAVQGFLEKLGLTNTTVWAAQYVVFVFIASMLALVLMWAFSRVNKAGEVPKLTGVKKWGTRLMVTLVTVPLALVLTTILDSMTTGLTTDMKDQAESPDSAYIVDTLSWAGSKNLSLGPAGISDFSTNKEDYKPTPDRIQALNESLDSAGDNTKAQDRLSKLKSGETISVEQYLNWIENTQSKNAVGRFVPSGNVNVEFNEQDEDWSQAVGIVQSPYFLSKKNNYGDDSADGDGGSSSSDDEEDSSSDDEDKDKDKDDKDSEDSTSDDSDSDSGDDEEAEEHAEEEDSKNQRIITIATFKDSAQFNLDKEGKSDAARVAWNRPSTYIYGAVRPGSATVQQTEKANYIYDNKKNYQDNDPETGEENGDISDDKKRKLMQANAASIALYNRYAGIQNSVDGGMPSLSTQSVAFLLQSNLSGGTLEYKGYNTIPDKSGVGKNAGINGTQFYRYTVPATGETDFTSRIAALSVQWIIAGIISVVALMALLRSPILLALVNMIKSFFSALFGNLSGLLNYVLYFTAFRMSFAFVQAAIWLGNHMARTFIDVFHLGDVGSGIVDKTEGMELSILGVDIIGDREISAFNNVLLVIISVGFAALVCWPFIKSTTSNGKVKQMSIISATTNLPYIVADMLTEKVDNIARMVGEKPMNNTRMYSNHAGINPGGQIKRGTSRALGIGAAGVGAALGGTAGAAAAKSATDNITGGGRDTTDASNEIGQSQTATDTARANSMMEDRKLPVQGRGGGENTDAPTEVMDTAQNGSNGPVGPSNGTPDGEVSKPIHGTAAGRDTGSHNLSGIKRNGGEAGTATPAGNPVSEMAENHSKIKPMPVDEMRSLMANPGKFQELARNKEDLQSAIDRARQAAKDHRGLAGSALVGTAMAGYKKRSAGTAKSFDNLADQLDKAKAQADMQGKTVKSGINKNPVGNPAKKPAAKPTGQPAKTTGQPPAQNPERPAPAKPSRKEKIRKVYNQPRKPIRETKTGMAFRTAKAVAQAPGDHGRGLEQMAKEMGNRHRENRERKARDLGRGNIPGKGGEKK